MSDEKATSDLEQESKEAENYLNAYRHHATTLRNWLVAYGVGGPVLLATNDAVRNALKKSEWLPWVGGAFLLAGALQVALSLFDKYADWSCFQQVSSGVGKAGGCRGVSAWWVETNWPSIVLELASIGLLGFATVTSFRAFL